MQVGRNKKNKTEVSFFCSIGPQIGTSVAPPSRESTDHGLTCHTLKLQVIRPYKFLISLNRLTALHLLQLTIKVNFFLRQELEIRGMVKQRTRDSFSSYNYYFSHTFVLIQLQGES